MFLLSKRTAWDTECYSGYESVAHLCEVLPLPPWLVIFIVPSEPATNIPVVLSPFVVMAGALTELLGLYASGSLYGHVTESHEPEGVVTKFARTKTMPARKSTCQLQVESEKSTFVWDTESHARMMSRSTSRCASLQMRGLGTM